MSLLGLLAFLNTIRKKIDNYHYQYHFCNICVFFASNYINLLDISILCSWGYLRSDFKQNKNGNTNRAKAAKKFERLKLNENRKIVCARWGLEPKEIWRHYARVCKSAPKSCERIGIFVVNMHFNKLCNGSSRISRISWRANNSLRN